MPPPWRKNFATASAPERIAVSVDMLSTGYNCRDLLNVVLMRPIFSPTEYIQIKGRGTRRFTFVIGNTEYEKKHFFLLDFCAVAEYFEDKYDYTAPLKVPQQEGTRARSARYEPRETAGVERRVKIKKGTAAVTSRREIPVWEGVGPHRQPGSPHRRAQRREGGRDDLPGLVRARHEGVRRDRPGVQRSVEAEDDDAIETISAGAFLPSPGDVLFAR